MKNSDQKPWPQEKGFTVTQIPPIISNPNSHFNQFSQIPNSNAYHLQPQFISHDDDWFINGGGGQENFNYQRGMTEESSRVYTDDDDIDERMTMINEGGSVNGGYLNVGNEGGMMTNEGGSVHGGDQALSYSGSGYKTVDNDGGGMMINEGGSVNGDHAVCYSGSGYLNVDNDGGMMLNEGGSVNGDQVVSYSGRDRDEVEDQEEEHYIHGITEKEYFATLPSGIRFEPHDHELILHYLKRKIDNQKMPHNQIKLVNLYKYSPYDVTARYPQLGENMWYFFTPRDRKYANGSRPNRAAGSGYWKATGKDKTIKMHGDHGPVVGFRKSLVFYDGNTRDGDKTSWTMHEYRVDEPSKRVRTCETDMRLDDYVLCKIIKKAERGSRIKRGVGAGKINKVVGTSNSQKAEEEKQPIINGNNQAINSNGGELFINNNPPIAADNKNNLEAPQALSFHQPMMNNDYGYCTSMAFGMPPLTTAAAGTVSRTCSFPKEEIVDLLGYYDEPAEVLDRLYGVKQPFNIPDPDFPRLQPNTNMIRYETEFSDPNMTRYGSEVSFTGMVTFPEPNSDPDDNSL